MGQIGSLFIFTANTLIRSAQVNSNFSDIKTAYNAHDTALTSVHGIGAATAISALDIDWSLNTIFTKTISGNTTFTFSNDAAGQLIYVLITASGSYTATFPAGIKWLGGTAPGQTPSGVDLYSFVKIGTTIYGFQGAGFA